MTKQTDNILAIHEESLPRSVLAPLRDLRSRNFLSPEDYVLMIKAAAVAPQKNHLLGFCCAFLAMRMNNISIVDTISMAYDLGEPLNLTWSQNRWRSEHDRLSKLFTLRQLLSEHVEYELVRFDELLPDKWPGYLIQNSRRLAFEGQRQNNCVASYQAGILTGRFAIAVVFVDKTRFTVQLGIHSPDSGNARLTVLQVRGAGNTTPSENQRNRINELLQIRPLTANLLPHPANSNSHISDAQTLLPILHELGIEKIMAYFSGYGDSGNWDTIDWEPSDIKISDNFTVRLPQRKNIFVDGQWRQVVEEQNVTLLDAVESIADQWLNHANTGCENGDGGSADLVILVTENSLEFKVDLNYTEKTCHFSRSVDLATGEIL